MTSSHDSVVGCQITVPSAQYVRLPIGGVVRELPEPPSIKVTFQLPDREEVAWDYYFFEPEEADAVARWLLAAIDDPNLHGIEEEERPVQRLGVVSAKELAVDRLALYGSKLVEGAKECDELGMIVDVAARPGEKRPFVRLSLVDDVVSYWLTVVQAKGIAQGLLDASERLRKNPPVMVTDLVLGAVKAKGSGGCVKSVEVEVGGQVHDPDYEYSRIELHIGGTDEDGRECGGDTWWLANDEVMKVSQFLQAASASAEQQLPGQVGEFRSEHDTELPQPWLEVSALPPPFEAGAMSLYVQLRFDDPLVRESGDDGALWLAPKVARDLAGLLATAIEVAATYPVVYSYDAPLHVVVADLKWAG